MKKKEIAPKYKTGWSPFRLQFDPVLAGLLAVLAFTGRCSAQQEPTRTAVLPTGGEPNEISVSGDYLIGKGHVAFPFGFSGGPSEGAKTVEHPERDSTSYGATITYSFNSQYYLDVSYAHGTSSGEFIIPQGQTLSDFRIREDQFQAYLRYSFKRFVGHRFSAYVRAGVSYNIGEMVDQTREVGVYHQDLDMTDILGNAGFGIGYVFWRPGTAKFRMSVQMEGEGFFGNRSQTTEERSDQGLFPLRRSSLDNRLYGGIGRLTIMSHYKFGESETFRVYAEVGIQAKYSKVDYSDFESALSPNVKGSYSELVWGPYVRAGFRYSF